MKKALDWMRDEIENYYDKEGVILSFDELKNDAEKHGEICSRKRIFIFDEAEFQWFIVLNPPRRTFLKCFSTETTAPEINEIINLVNQRLEENVKGNFEIFKINGPACQ